MPHPSKSWRNRIIGHQRVRAGDLVPHPLNPRLHPDFQAKALHAILGRIGFARSLLAYRMADGRLGLIDGHLRQSFDPDALVDVEILDLREEEARELLLSLDPLARLALTDQERAETLRQLCPVQDSTLQAFFGTVGQAEEELHALIGRLGTSPFQKFPKEQASADCSQRYLVVAECPCENEQKELVAELRARGLTCRLMAG